jgi:lysophospholipase L1-like esterase
MKSRTKAAFLFVMMSFIFFSCAQNSDDGSTGDGTGSGGITKVTDKTPVIYLAGDSTVKTYTDAQYIGGWGQYLQYFLNSSVTVVNCAQGGRSSRSFINEGRLWNISDSDYSYTFTENNGKSIESVIKEGDFLLIQFGHNDDNTKYLSSPATNYSTLYNRMVPLGADDADSTAVFPVTAGEQTSTSSLTTEFTLYATASEQTAALTEIGKYGSKYYAYGSGTYKWYLKQYIDFARSKGAIPVLVTPVSRVKYDSAGTTIISGDGLHGENFAYVRAVRQLAEEEDCLLIDLFAETKSFLETATSTYGSYLMALVPNTLEGEWPSGYDSTYGVASLGYTGIEATHYNKYGAFVTAAKVAEYFLTDSSIHKNNTEYYTFTNYVNTTPSAYIDPSNLISKTYVAKIESLFKTVSVTNPARTYPAASSVVDRITNELTGDVTQNNYLTFKTTCESIRAAYIALNVDDRSSVTNLSTLESYEKKVADLIDANTPDPVGVEVINADSFTAQAYSETVTGTTVASGTASASSYNIVATAAKPVTIMTSANTTTYNGTAYATKQCIALGGGATFGVSGTRYIEFTTTGACEVTVIASSGGTRTLNLVSSSAPAAIVATFSAPTAVTVTSNDISAGGTYQLGSSGSGIYVYDIIIEYY